MASTKSKELSVSDIYDILRYFMIFYVESSGAIAAIEGFRNVSNIH